MLHPTSGPGDRGPDAGAAAVEYGLLIAAIVVTIAVIALALGRYVG
jgi:Flp pilus assembly pilin Flp